LLDTPRAPRIASNQSLNAKDNTTVEVFCF
jgi:hypothetical protein